MAREKKPQSIRYEKILCNFSKKRSCLFSRLNCCFAIKETVREKDSEKQKKTCAWCNSIEEVMLTLASFLLANSLSALTHFSLRHFHVAVYSGEIFQRLNYFSVRVKLSV